MQTKLKRIEDERMQLFLFGMCWLAYFSSYIGRLNYSSAMPAMIRSSILTTSEAGFISMLYFFAYGIGQFLNGMLADRIHPGKMIFIGVFASGILNCVMGFFPYFHSMAFFWCINGYTQAMIWPPIMRIFAEMMTEDKQMKYCVHITSTMALGTLASYLLSAVVVAVANWQYVFFAAAFWMCMAALLFKYGFKKIEDFAAEHGVCRKNEMADKCETRSFSTPFSKLLVNSGLLFLLVPVIVHGVLKDGVTAWVPTYISEIFSASPTISILVTTILPVINLSGAYAAQFMYQKFFRQHEVKTAAFFFSIPTGALLLLWKFGAVNMFLTAGLLAVITSAMMAVNTLFVNLLPLRFEKTGRVSTVSGFLNAMAYLGCAISTYVIGILVQYAGWSLTIFCWLMITVIAMLFCFGLRNYTFGDSQKKRG